MKQFAVRKEDLDRIAELSVSYCFPVWYDLETNKLCEEWEASDSSVWVFDVEQEETPEFIAEITKVVLTENGYI